MSAASLFTVAAEVFERRPDYVVGCVLARGIDNARDNPQLERLLADAEADAQQRLAGADPKELPSIAIWRQAFSANGWTPSKYLASVEALAKRVAKGLTLPRVNPIVDLGNVIALRCLVPVGAHDLTQVELSGSPLTVRMSRAGDSFQPTGDTAPETPDAGEIVYVLGNAVRTRRWVWRQAADARITPATHDVFFPIDGFANVTDAHVLEAVELLSDTCRHLFSAEVTTGVVTADRQTFP